MLKFKILINGIKRLKKNRGVQHILISSIEFILKEDFNILVSVFTQNLLYVLFLMINLIKFYLD